MRTKILESIGLICPRCRGDEALRVNALRTDDTDRFLLEGLLGCLNPRCGAQYPVIHGVPVLFADMKVWWRSLSAPPGPLACASELAEYLAQLAHAAPEVDQQLGLCQMYLDAHYGDLVDGGGDTEPFWRHTLTLLGPEQRDGVSLDMGCAVGRLTLELGQRCDRAIGLDASLGMLIEAARVDREQQIRFQRRRRAGRNELVSAALPTSGNVLFVCADAMNPPFPAATFDLVAALNLLDNVNVPLTLLQQIDALLKPAGSMLLSSPYNWRSDLTQPHEWLEDETMDGPSMLRAILVDDLVPAVNFRYRVTQQQDRIPWVLRHHERHQQHYAVDALIAQKVH